MALVSDILAIKGARVHCITPEATVHDAVEKMTACSVGSLIVRSGDRIEGIFTERDALRRVMLAGRLPRATPVREVMTPRVVCVDPRTTVDACMALMTQERIRHLPVAEGPTLLGVISIGDLVKCVASEREVEVRYLTEYITGDRSPAGGVE